VPSHESDSDKVFTSFTEAVEDSFPDLAAKVIDLCRCSVPLPVHKANAHDTCGRCAGILRWNLGAG
jgi:hypothetical protein